VLLALGDAHNRKVHPGPEMVTSPGQSHTSTKRNVILMTHCYIASDPTIYSKRLTVCEYCGSICQSRFERAVSHKFQKGGRPKGFSGHHCSQIPAKPAQFQTVFNANFQFKDFVSQKTDIVPQWAVNSFLRAALML
jgi:hypothetical protein